MEVFGIVVSPLMVWRRRNNITGDVVTVVVRINVGVARRVVPRSIVVILTLSVAER